MSLYTISLLLITIIVASASAQHPFGVKDLINCRKVIQPIVSPNGENAVFNVYHYNDDDNTHTNNIQMVEINSGNTVSLTTAQVGVSDGSAAWLSDQVVAFLRDGKVWSVDIKENNGSPKLVLEHPLSISNLKAHPESRKVMFTMDVLGGGSISEAMQLEKEQENKRDTGTLYERLMVRHWDRWIDSSRKTHLFVQSFTINEQGLVAFNDDISNLMNGSPLETPIRPFGGSEHFDFSPDGQHAVFASKVPGVEEAWSTNSNIYLLPVDGSEELVSLSVTNGADTNPSFSPDGKFVSYLSMQTPQYEADLNRIVLYNLEAKRSITLTQDYDRSIGSILWNSDSTEIFATVDDTGANKIVRINVSDGNVKEIVGNNHNGDLSLFFQNGTPHLLFSQSSLSSPVELFTLEAGQQTPKQLTNYNGALLADTQRSEPEAFWFKGWNDEPVMGWFFKPVGFSEQNSKYPLAFLAHGGPESAWGSSWSYRWNPQVWAGSGYAVVAINFHGSTGYGSNFTRSILGNWGAAPYEDLMIGLDHVLEKYSFIDSQRICALGGSYGGYMANWINGHTNRFNCLVNHDGIFDSKSLYYSTEELWFPEYEFGSPAFSDSSLYDQWNPRRFIHKWETPTLVIHSEKDYRIPISDGLSTFTALQRRSIPSRLLVFPDENHWILKEVNLVRWYTEIDIWMGMWTALETTDKEVRRWNEKRSQKAKESALKIQSSSPTHIEL